MASPPRRKGPHGRTGYAGYSALSRPSAQRPPRFPLQGRPGPSGDGLPGPFSAPFSALKMPQDGRAGACAPRPPLHRVNRPGEEC